MLRLKPGAPQRAWVRFWMRFAGRSLLGRLSARLAVWAAPPHKARAHLADLCPRGFVDPLAVIAHPELRLGQNVWVAERAVIYRARGGGPVVLEDCAHLHAGTTIETGEGGRVTIGRGSSILPQCQLMAYRGSITIGAYVQLAQGCSVYPFNHGIAPGELIIRQPLETNGDVVIEDDAWLGTGAVVLSGVRIGRGAVIGAGAVVTRNVPPGAIAAGVPARVIGSRERTELMARVQQEVRK